MISFDEETYISLTDLAKLRCAASILAQVCNREAILKASQQIYAEIDRLEKAIDEVKQKDGDA